MEQTTLEELFEISIEDLQPLPELYLGELRIECPKCGWGYRQQDGRVIVKATYTRDWWPEDSYKLGEVSCDECGHVYVVKIKNEKIYTY